ncbi:MAG TPA: hemerythrin family protein [Fibrobacteria bacterium]|nr:hemerythrin family protein [Fibrobacteria bacterium]
MEHVPTGHAKLSLGWSEMDQQHDTLFRALHTLDQAPRRRPDDLREMRRIFSVLADHFRWEETEMARLSFPDRSRHIADHQRELWSLAQLLRRLEDLDDLDAQALSDCTAWTLRHVASMDADFVQFALDRETWDLRRECMELDYENRLASFSV